MILKNLTQSVVAISLLVEFTAAVSARDIVHDAEYYVLNECLVSQHILDVFARFLPTLFRENFLYASHLM